MGRGRGREGGGGGGEKDSLVPSLVLPLWSPHYACTHTVLSRTRAVMYSRLCSTTLVPSGEPHPLPPRTGLEHSPGGVVTTELSDGTTVCGCGGESSVSSTFRSHGTMYWSMCRCPELGTLSKRCTISREKCVRVGKERGEGGLEARDRPAGLGLHNATLVPGLKGEVGETS